MLDMKSGICTKKGDCKIYDAMVNISDADAALISYGCTEGVTPYTFENVGSEALLLKRNQPGF